MAAPVNIYRSIMFDLNPKVKAYIDTLNQEGQIDLDTHGYPYVISVEREGPNFVVKMVRNQKAESFVLNPRKKADPVITWNPNDGYVRKTQKQVIDMDDGKEEKPRGERQRRVAFEAFEQIVETILKE